MTKIITATYEQGVLVPLQDSGLQDHQAVRLQIVPSRVCVTAAVARRKVNRCVLDNVNYLMDGEQPVLAEMDRLLWRVPVVLTYPPQGVVGSVGFVDVDAESGELLLTPKTIGDIWRNARALLANSAAEAASAS